jgi:DNA-binding winged helix-turn-helix (wHTH) protein/predicted transcriptional regulator
MMKIAEVIDADVPVCQLEETLQSATEKMWLWGCESLPVCDTERHFMGSISMRTVCLRAHFTGKRLEEMFVHEALSHEKLACRSEDPVPKVMNVMCRGHLWHLPVVDAGGRLTGMVNYADLQDRLATARDTMHIVPHVEELDQDVATRLDRLPGWTLLLKQRELISPTGDRTHLSRAERRLLIVFAEHPGEVMSRAALMRKVCNRDWVPSDRYIDVLVASLRRKFGERAADAQMIRTVHNDGYVFTPRVTTHEAVAPASTMTALPPNRVGSRSQSGRGMADEQRRTMAQS